MNVSLTPNLERFVDERVASGRYGSASEVVREGLRLLEERELTREVLRRDLEDKITVGLEDARAGRLLDAEDVLRKVRTRVRKLHPDR